MVRQNDSKSKHCNATYGSYERSKKATVTR